MIRKSITAAVLVSLAWVGLGAGPGGGGGTEAYGAVKFQDDFSGIADGANLSTAPEWTSINGSGPIVQGGEVVYTGTNNGANPTVSGDLESFGAVPAATDNSYGGLVLNVSSIPGDDTDTTDTYALLWFGKNTVFQGIGAGDNMGLIIIRPAAVSGKYNLGVKSSGRASNVEVFAAIDLDPDTPIKVIWQVQDAFDNTSKVDLWINRRSEGLADASVASGTVPDNNRPHDTIQLTPFARLSGPTDATAAATLDRLIVATTFDEITTFLPEPTGMFIFAVGGLWMSRRRARA